MCIRDRISGILLTGCVDLLQEPLSFPTPENIEYTEENVTSLAKGLYTSLWGGNYAYNCRTILMGLGADDVSCGSYTKRGVHWDQLHVDMASMENVEEICKMIAAFGTGITDYKLVTVPVDRVMSRLPKERKELLLAQLEKIMNEAKKETGDESVVGIIMRSKRDFFILNIKEDDIECQTIRFEHNNNDVLFDLSEESDGTVRILDLLEILLSDEGKTYVIDELDRCLHPSLTYKYIQTFLQLAAKKNIQLSLIHISEPTRPY